MISSGDRYFLSHALITGIAGCSLLFSIDAGAAEINFSLDAEEIYSNNITLAPNETAQSDFVTRLAPSIEMDYSAKAAELRAQYTYEWLNYARESSFDQDFHQLDADGGVDLIGKYLRLLGQAAYSQINSDPRQPQENSNITVGGNRSNVGLWQIGPRWEQEIRNSRIDAFYKIGKVDFDDPASQDVKSQRAGASLANSAASTSSLTYKVSWDYWILDYETFGKVRDQEVSLILHQEVASSVQLSGLVGLDSDLADPRQSSLTELRWEAGIDYSRPDGHVSASIGERYFGTVFRFSADKTLAKWTYKASYSETPGTSESLRLREAPKPPDDELPPPDSGLDTPGNAARFIHKRADGTIRWGGHASNWYWQVWWEERDNLADPREAGQPVGTATLEDQSVGTSINYGWEIGARTSTDFSVSWDQREFLDLVLFGDEPGEVKSNIDTFRFRASIRYALGMKTKLHSSIQYRDSSGTSSFNEFDEFRVSVGLTRTF